ncbi:MAG: di-trans,poly-cis-decaprenylcistransferase, partial [Candidatus Portnoybacteria bacterium RBG_13_41_18]
GIGFFIPRLRAIFNTMAEKQKSNYDPPEPNEILNRRGGLPKHVAIIPDGNRRWARKKGLLPWIGHRQGVNNFEKILETVRDLGLFCVTFWGGSYDNLTKRQGKEIRFLKEIYRAHFARLFKNTDIDKNKVRVNIYGCWRELLEERIKKPMEAVIEKTKNYNSQFLNFLIGYNGTNEMVEAISSIVKKSKEDQALKITPQLIKDNLWTCDLPPVDLVIRTGLEDDPHWSNGFMMWDTADSQFYFTETLWPDFPQKEFLKAIESYTKRERRMGA